MRSPADDLTRNVKSLLNKVCPENVGTIAEKIAAIEISNAEQLGTVIKLIFEKALVEPHYCETYSDLVFGLKAVFPEFPSPTGGKPISFRSSVLTICQYEFEDLLQRFEPENQVEAEDAAEVRKKCKDRLIANIKFIGHLFLRQLLSAKVVGSVSKELALCGAPVGQRPEEHALECVCELLMSIGFTLDASPTGSQVVQEVCDRLRELKDMKTVEGKAAYSKRIQFLVQGLLDTREAGWAKRSFKSSAKTKEEIRLEQVRDLVAVFHGDSPAAAEHTVAGQRPAYLAAASAP